MRGRICKVGVVGRRYSSPGNRFGRRTMALYPAESMRGYSDGIRTCTPRVSVWHGGTISLISPFNLTVRDRQPVTVTDAMRLPLAMGADADCNLLDAHASPTDASAPESAPCGSVAEHPDTPCLQYPSCRTKKTIRSPSNGRTSRYVQAPITSPFPVRPAAQIALRSILIDDTDALWIQLPTRNLLYHIPSQTLHSTRRAA